MKVSTHKLLAFGVLSCLPGLLQADTEFGDTVPTELVRSILNITPFGETALYSDIADAFPDLGLPADYEILGSVDYGYRISVVLKSDDSESLISETLSDLFEANGYTEFEVAAPPRSNNGFVSRQLPDRPNYPRYCHDQDGFLSFSIQNHGAENIVNVSQSFDNDSRSCVAKAEEQQRAMTRISARNLSLQQYIPTMVLPDNGRRRMPVFGFGMSGSGSDLETEGNIRIDWSIDAVYAHFKDQIQEQGWELDSENIGVASANGTWTRSPEAGLDLIGTLTVLAAGDDNFELKFRLLNTGPGNARSGLFLRSQ